jgi:hypothetical protein
MYLLRLVKNRNIDFEEHGNNALDIPNFNLVFSQEVKEHTGIYTRHGYEFNATIFTRYNDFENYVAKNQDYVLTHYGGKKREQIIKKALKTAKLFFEKYPYGAIYYQK